jgi:hypothetical protein
MLNMAFRTWLIAGWISTVAVIVAVSMAMGANLSTTSLLLALGVAPAAVMAVLRSSASSPTVAEILRAVETKDGRS